MRKIEYTVSKEYENVPLYFFLREYAGVSTRIIQTLRHTEKSVFVNGTESRVVDKVKNGDVVSFFLPEKTQPPILWETDLIIIYEDEDLLIINKPSGVSVHPTKNHPNGTLCNAVAAHLKKEKNDSFVARAVGRLDKVTSGVMIFAKNSFVASRLNGNLEKTYLALVQGHLDGEGTVDAPIVRPDITKTLRAVGEQGDRAVTHWRSVARLDGATLLEVKTETGRTHQIRVHLSHIGHSLVGDVMYGGKCTDNIKRAALHCNRVSVIHPVTQEKLTFMAEVPDDMKKELEKAVFSVDK
ncbi:MAG: RluA family pseudouridine synthase [Acutalibacteraceae bacterium]